MVLNTGASKDGGAQGNIIGLRGAAPPIFLLWKTFGGGRFWKKICLKGPFQFHDLPSGEQPDELTCLKPTNLNNGE